MPQPLELKERLRRRRPASGSKAIHRCRVYVDGKLAGTAGDSQRSPWRCRSRRPATALRGLPELRLERDGYPSVRAHAAAPRRRRCDLSPGPAPGRHCPPCSQPLLSRAIQRRRAGTPPAPVRQLPRRTACRLRSSSRRAFGQSARAPISSARATASSLALSPKQRDGPRLASEHPGASGDEPSRPTASSASRS